MTCFLQNFALKYTFIYYSIKTKVGWGILSMFDKNTYIFDNFKVMQLFNYTFETE